MTHKWIEVGALVAFPTRNHVRFGFKEFYPKRKKKINKRALAKESACFLEELNDLEQWENPLRKSRILTFGSM